MAAFIGMKLSRDQKDTIVTLYTSPKNPTAFGSISTFKKFLHAEKSLDIPLSQLTALLLANVPAVSIEKSARWNFPRRVHLSSSIDSLWAAG